MTGLKRWAIYFVMLALCVGGLACKGGGDKSSGSSAKNEAPMEMANIAQESYGPAAASQMAMAPGGQAMPSMDMATRADYEPKSPDSAPPKPSQTEAQTARQVVYESWMGVAVHDVAESLGKVRAYTEGLGGFVQLSTSTRLVLRIPAAQHDAAVAYLKTLGDVRHLRMTSQDVTDQYTDLVARIENLKAIQSRYEALLAQATRIEDRLIISRELRRISQELSILEEQLVVLKDRVALCTITLDLERKQPTHVARVTPPQPFAFVREHGAQSLLR